MSGPHLKPVSAFQPYVPPLSLSKASHPNPPKRTHIPISPRKGTDIKCMICAQRILAGGTFAEISHYPISNLREYICSGECFNKYLETTKAAPNTDKEELAAPRIHKQYKPPVPKQDSSGK